MIIVEPDNYVDINAFTNPFEDVESCGEQLVWQRHINREGRRKLGAIKLTIFAQKGGIMLVVLPLFLSPINQSLH